MNVSRICDSPRNPERMDQGGLDISHGALSDSIKRHPQADFLGEGLIVTIAAQFPRHLPPPSQRYFFMMVREDLLQDFQIGGMLGNQPPPADNAVPEIPADTLPERIITVQLFTHSSLGQR